VRANDLGNDEYGLKYSSVKTLMHFGLLNTVSSNKFEIRVGRDFIMKLAHAI
jgi:hypothetical protein